MYHTMSLTCNVRCQQYQVVVKVMKLKASLEVQMTTLSKSRFQGNVLDYEWNILDFIQQSFFSGGNSASVRSTTSSAAFPSPSSPRPSIPSISDALAGKFNALVTIDPNWQSTKKSVRERNAVMCNNALMADVYFNVGADIGEDVTQIPAHKYVLSTSSTVFYAMFFGGLAEPRDVIDVPDVEPEAFLAMLRYMGWDYGIFK